MNTPPFLHQLLTLPTVVNALLSPDGRWVAFSWYRVHENVDVFLVPTDGSSKPIALTHTPDATQLVSWTADSRAVLVVEDHDGDERNRLFRVDIEQPLRMQPLTIDRPPFFLRGGNLSPDGQSLYYGANYDFEAKKEIESTWLYRHNLLTGTLTPLVKPAKPNYMVISLNESGTHLLYSTKDRHSSGRQFHLVDVNGQNDEEILNFGDDRKVFARWFPDGRHILVLSESTDGKPQQHISLGVYHWPSKKLRWLVNDPGRNIESALVSPDGLVIVDEIRFASHKTSYIDLQGAPLETPVSEQPFPDLEGNLLPLVRAAYGAWIAMYYASNSPVELVRCMPASRLPADLGSLTHSWEYTGLRAEQLTPAERFQWPSSDGLEIQGWLYRARPNPRRAILFIHGGPSAHSEERVNPQIQYFVSCGFNVLDINYRGSTGYGLRFREAIKADGWGGREQADITTAAEALIRAGLAEPGKVSVTGTSYGGYSAWFQITHAASEVIGASAPICGMTDLVVDYETTRPDIRPLSEEMMGGRPDQVPERYFERSPIHFVQDIHGKLLIVQGALDPNVSPENVRQVRTRLDAHSIPYELLVFEDEGHGIRKPANQEKLYQELARFFDSALRA